MATRDLSQPQLQLLTAKRPLEAGVVIASVPGTLGFRVDAVHHDMDVLVRSVIVSHYKSLMLSQAQVPKGAVDDLKHCLSAKALLRWQIERQVIDGFLDPRSLIGSNPHEGGDDLWIG